MISVTVFKTSILVYSYFYTQNIGGFYVCSNSGYDKGFSGEAYSAFCSTVDAGEYFSAIIYDG